MSVSPSTRTWGGLSANKQQHLSTILSGTLEAWAHQILYTREVYSKETFGTTRFMGIKCFVNRHPGVVSYIDETVRLAIPAFLQGTADQLSLLIIGNKRPMDDGNADKEENMMLVEECILEEYTLRLMNIQGDLKQSAGMDPQFERSLRDLVLRVQTFQGKPSSSSSSKADKESISFRLELRLTETPNLTNDMKKALMEGTWFAPENKRVGKPPAVVRPLHKADTPVGTLLFMQRRVANKSWESVASSADAATGERSP